MTTDERLLRVVARADRVHNRRSLAEESKLNNDVLICSELVKELASLLLETRACSLDTEEETDGS